jgi:hypothetical protein
MDCVVTPSSVASAERRRTPRQKFVTKAMLYRENRTAAPQRIMMRDVSLMGVGFESPEPVEAGTRCRILIEAGPARINWRIRIVCCGKVDGGDYLVGCQFIPAELDLVELTDETPGVEARAGATPLVPA